MSVFVTRAKILKEVAERHELTADEITKVEPGSRQKEKVDARAEYVYRLRNEIGSSFGEMGEFVGNRTPATLINLFRKHQEQIKEAEKTQ